MRPLWVNCKMWTKTADEKEEQIIAPDETRQSEIANELANALESLVGNRWSDLIAGLNLNEEEEKWANARLRFTIIDEQTGDDLIGGQGY